MQVTVMNQTDKSIKLDLKKYTDDDTSSIMPQPRKKSVKKVVETRVVKPDVPTSSNYFGSRKRKGSKKASKKRSKKSSKKGGKKGSKKGSKKY